MSDIPTEISGWKYMLNYIVIYRSIDKKLYDNTIENPMCDNDYTIII